MKKKNYKQHTSHQIEGARDNIFNKDNIFRRNEVTKKKKDNIIRRVKSTKTGFRYGTMAMANNKKFIHLTEETEKNPK